MSSKPTYAGWPTNSPRRTHGGISTHNSSLGVQHAIVGDTNSTNTNPHVAHVVDCSLPPLQCDGHTMEAHIGGFSPSMFMDVRSGCLQLFGKDAHCCKLKGAGVPKVMCSPSEAHWHVVISRSRKYWKPP